jgi:two-component system, OmpR family, sensor histidine kinase SenX3
MTPRPGHLRALQIGFLVLLGTCFAQATYWIVDQVLYTAEVRDRLEDHHAADAGAARWMLNEGAPAPEVRRLFPHLVLTDGPDGVRVEQDYVAALDRERYRRLNRYGWEGAFFLLVLLGSMAVIARVLRQSGELVRRQQNFLAAVSHEFKSPLASLRLSAETLELRELDSTATRRVAGRMVAEVDRLEVMVTDILDAARLGEGRVVPDPLRLDLGEEVARVVGNLACRARPARVELSAEIPPGLEVWADPAALRAVLSNLLRNAVHSVAASGGGSVRVQAQRESSMIRIEVHDDGTGFEPDEARKLFDKFYRPGDELRRRTPGTGLGLYIVENFVRLAGGRVEATSPGPGQGACFRVHWPIPPEAPAPRSAALVQEGRGR